MAKAVSARDSRNSSTVCAISWSPSPPSEATAASNSAIPMSALPETNAINSAALAAMTSPASKAAGRPVINMILLMSGLSTTTGSV